MTAHTQWQNGLMLSKKKHFSFIIQGWFLSALAGDLQNSCACTWKGQYFLLSDCCNLQIRWEVSLSFFVFFSSNLFPSFKFSQYDWAPSSIKFYFGFLQIFSIWWAVKGDCFLIIFILSKLVSFCTKKILQTGLLNLNSTLFLASC